MKVLLVAFVALVSSQTFATQNLKLSNFVGRYDLEQNLNGFCPSAITVEITTFLNQTAKQSLNLFCSSMEDCTRIETDENGYQTHIIDNLVYQFPHINTGLQSDLETNPMTGMAMGYRNSLQSLKGNVLSAIDSNRTLFGVVNWKNTFDGKLENGIFSFKKTSYNILSGKVVTSESECVYKKVE